MFEGIRMFFWIIQTSLLDKTTSAMYKKGTERELHILQQCTYSCLYRMMYHFTPSIVQLGGLDVANLAYISRIGKPAL